MFTYTSLLILHTNIAGQCTYNLKVKAIGKHMIMPNFEKL